MPTGGTGVGPQGPGCVVGPPGYDKSPALSVLTAMFLHGGWLHLLGNMLFLLIFGNNIEDRMGHVRFPLFYVACGYAASYGFALLNADSADPLIGASGADRRGAGRLSGAVPEGPGLGPRPVPGLPAAAAARLDGAGLLVRPAGGVLRPARASPPPAPWRTRRTSSASSRACCSPGRSSAVPPRRRTRKESASDAGPVEVLPRGEGPAGFPGADERPRGRRPTGTGTSPVPFSGRPAGAARAWPRRRRCRPSAGRRGVCRRRLPADGGRPPRRAGAAVPGRR